VTRNHAWLKRRTAALNLRNLIGRGLARRDGAWVLAPDQHRDGARPVQPSRQADSRPPAPQDHGPPGPRTRASSQQD
jgi:hypothetical protein